jgi:stearoyl-CoA desaturase (delta-9 desaturase)
MADRCRVNSLVELEGSSPIRGVVRWDPVHSIWHGGMLAVAVLFAPVLISWSAVTLFFVLTGASLLLGHSVGFHRRLIHRSFECPLWLERILVWIGTCVGMGGPLWMIRTHDLRDWAQRQTDCHDYFAHRGGMLRDYWRQVHCRLDLASPPEFDFGRAGEDRFYRFLETTWMAQQVPIAALLYAAGGWGWVVWGVCMRVTISVTGHWIIGHLAHTRGPQSWLVKHAGVQAHDVPWAAIPTMGEAWHNNHHAYPGSARIGLYPGQSDWGYLFIRALQRAGLAWNVVLPEHLDRAAALRPAPSAQGNENAVGTMVAPRAAR